MRSCSICRLLMFRTFSVNPLYGLSFTSKRAARNFVELFDLIDGVEDFGAVHCFNVIDSPL